MGWKIFGTEGVDVLSLLLFCTGRAEGPNNTVGSLFCLHFHETFGVLWQVHTP